MTLAADGYIRAAVSVLSSPCMRSSSTCCTHTKPLDFNNPQITSDEKLDFVEHVLDVLIESRYGTGNPYTRLGESPVTIGHSQIFANVRLLSAAEIEAHLNAVHRHFPGALLCGCLCELCELGVTKRTFHAKSAKNAKGTQRSRDVECMSATLQTPAHAGGSTLARGSPTVLGRSIF